jgi:uncharacterized protein
MIRLKLWQWIVLVLPIATIVGFVMVAAGIQIHQWGISWIWAIFTIVLVGWRSLLVRWTKPMLNQVEAVMAEVSKEIADSTITANQNFTQIGTALQEVLTASQNDPLIWEDWQKFWGRCQELVSAIAHTYYPDVKYPLLNIYVPQAYSLIRGTVDDMDMWMQKLSPALNQVTIGQTYEAYEVYRRLEPSARKFMRAWSLAQWLLNPAAAVAKKASQGYAAQANQQLLGNLSQLLREAALRNLCNQAIALYGGMSSPTLEIPTSTPNLPSSKTQTLRSILEEAQPSEEVDKKPINILLLGRTGAGKSSLINTLFESDLAAVDVLPSTDKIQNYQWQTEDGETLTLLDTPGYEQVKRPDLQKQVLDYTKNADLLLLVTPALDPSLQMDVDFLKEIKAAVPDLPLVTIVTQVDRLRPIREWEPPYNWQSGARPKEVSIREATEYRAQQLNKFFSEFSNLVLPVVTADITTNRNSWGIDALSIELFQTINPAKQLRLGRFLRDLDARSLFCAKIIDNYSFQMTTTQGLTTLLKSPVLQFISTLTIGSPHLAYLLAEKIPVEQLPVVIGKLQMTYEIYSLLNTNKSNTNKSLISDLPNLWKLLLENSATPDRNAWAFGHALVEYWTKNLTPEQLQQRYEFYLQ